jgi:Tfp pilus assembly protein PilN
MKQIPVNLATFPFERTRRIRRTLTVATFVLVLLSTLQAGAAVFLITTDGSLLQPRPSAEATSLPAQLRDWQQEANLLAAAANPARDREVAQAVTLANALIAWRGLPWGSLFDTLEAALPTGVRLELVRPSSDPDGVRVELIAAAASRSDLGDLLAALEQRPTLSRVVPLYEERAEDGRYLMRIRATFRHADRQALESR